MSLLNIRELTREEIDAIHVEDFTRDFPPAERKPWEMIMKMQEAGNYICLGLFEDDQLRGYAYLAKNPGGKRLMLDYFAILETYRSGGYGGKFLGLLRKFLGEYEGLILEVESLSHATNDEEYQQRKRRFDFYFANGLEETRIQSSIKKVVYRVLYYSFGEPWRDEEIIDDINAIYRMMLPGEYFEKCYDYVRIEEEKAVDSLKKRFEDGIIYTLDNDIMGQDIAYTPHPKFKGVALKHLVTGDMTDGLISCHIVKVEPGCVLDFHSHENAVEIHEVIEGSGICTIRDKNVKYNVGVLGVMPKGVPHKIAAGKDGITVLAKFAPPLK